MSSESNFRDYHRAEMESVRQKLSQLGSKTYVGRALAAEILSEVRDRIETAPEHELNYGYWPYIYSFFVSQSNEALAELDADIDLVLSRTDSTHKNSVTRFLYTRERRTGVWFGGLFEVWCKATFIRKVADVKLDVLMPNGRDHDISAVIGGRAFRIECTVLTEDDESREVWGRFLENKRLKADQVLVRPGPFCPPNAKGPSPYYEALRLYAKVFDKLTMNLDPAKGQFAEDEPNVLLVCFAGSGVGFERPGVCWGFEELFASNPKISRTVVPESFTDISLDAWADFRAKELIAQRKITVDWYCENSGRVLEAPRRLAGALGFDNSKLAGARVNYNAWEQCRMSHSEMADLERLVTGPAKYLT